MTALPVRLRRRLKALRAEADGIEALAAREIEAWQDFAWFGCRLCGGAFITETTRQPRYCSDACRVRAWKRDRKAKADRAKRRATMEAE